MNRTGSDDAIRSSDGSSSRDGPSDGSGGRLERAAVVAVGVLLMVAVVGANAAVAADRTVLNGDHVIEEMAEDELFAEETERFRGEVSDEIAAGTDGLDLPPGIDLGGFDAATAAEESVTETYVREEMTANVESLYAFVHGERDDLEFAVDLRPVKEGVSASVTESVAIDTPLLVAAGSDGIDRERVAALEESEERFEQAQLDISGQELEAIKTDVEADVQAREYTPELTDALVSLQFTVVDALAGELTYDAYLDALERDETELREALGAEAVATTEDTLVLDDGDTSEEFAELADIAGLVGTLAVVLPVLVGGLVAVVAAVTRDLWRTVRTVGGAVLGAGTVGLVVVVTVSQFVLPDRGDGDFFEEALLVAIEGAFGTLGTQSALLALGGIALLGLAVAERRGVLVGAEQ